MIIRIPDVLSADQVGQARALLSDAQWVDGRVTAGHQSARSKNNEQLPEGHPLAERLGGWILSALEKNPLFLAAAIPNKIYPPLFNRYAGGQSFGTHVDNAIRVLPGTEFRVRTDLSATLFLTDDYDGGELCIEDTYGVHNVKLPAGHMVLYPANSLHFVRPVTRGARVASFFWIQSSVRDDGQRAILFDLDLAIQKLNREAPQSTVPVQLTGVYHNLLRQWADV